MQAREYTRVDGNEMFLILRRGQRAFSYVDAGETCLRGPAAARRTRETSKKEGER